MKRILLFCSAGMSTSLLVERMKDAAKERGLDVSIVAVASTTYKEDMQRADVCLLGPQVRYMLKDAKVIADELGIPVDVINMVDYGMVDGAKVLDHALRLLG